VVDQAADYRAILDQARTIRLPVHLIEKAPASAVSFAKVMREKGREAVSREVSKIMGLSVVRVNEILRAIQEPVSLETPILSEEKELKDVIIDEKAISPFKTLENNEASSRIETVALLAHRAGREDYQDAVWYWS